MIILSKSEYYAAMSEMQSLARKGFKNLTHEENQRYDELVEHLYEWKKKNLDEIKEDEEKIK